MKRTLLPSLALVLLAGCGGSDSGADPSATAIPVGNDGATITADKAGITAYIQTKAYEAWVKEPAIHGSIGPHNDVRTYFNGKYASARRGDAFPMPVGAMSVKELYEGTDLDGWAVAVKTKEGTGPDTWTWWEGFEGDLPDVKFFGVANPTCEGCHSGGSATDRSLTPTLP